jgi:RNA polymerase sigma factor (sigma-70 family)
MTDWELLYRYRKGSEESFAELTKRHTDWLYSASLRRVGDPDLAADVTQAALIALALDRKIHARAVISAWLFQAMRFAASKALRSEGRRKRHEFAARQLRRKAREFVMKSDWDEIAPLLEDAVARLGKKDREAILMRFYERRSLAQVARALEISEEGARKRIRRAIGKLRADLIARGCSAPPAVLGAALTTHLVSPAPAALMITAPARTGPAVELGQEALHMIRRTHLMRALAGVMAAILPIGVAVVLLAGHGREQTGTATALAAPASATRPIALSTTLPATRPTTLTIDQIVAGVRKAENAFQNLYVKDFRTTIDIMAKGQNEWKPSPMVHAGSAWYDTDPQGRMRIYYSLYVMPWEPLAGQRAAPGQVPWSVEEVDESWDGKQGREIRVRGGFPGKTHRDRSARVTPDRPMLLGGYSRYDAGAGFTWQYRVTPEELSIPPRAIRPFSDFIVRLVKGGEPPEVSQQTVNDFNTVRLRWVGFRHWTSETYWLAPDCGFALVKHERVDSFPNYSSTTGLEVKQLKEIAKGIWFPMRASMVMHYGAGKDAYCRFNYTAASAVANDPKFDPAIFTPKIPAGYVVADLRENRQNYLVMQDLTKHELHRGDILPNVKPGKLQRPDTAKGK